MDNTRPLDLPLKNKSPYADAPRLAPDVEVDPRVLLGATGPVELEIGPGHGGFILERLAGDAEARILGFEVRRKWATLVDRKIAELGWAQRGRVFAEDARSMLARMTPGSLSRIYVHFPDPWWKKRHAKRRVISSSFVDHAARLLVPGGDVFAQTDVPDRAEAFEEVFALHPAFEPWGETARVEDPNFGARSPRERRAMKDGLPIVRLRFRRK